VEEGMSMLELTLHALQSIEGGPLTEVSLLIVMKHEE
jgi:hypothetical protein